MRKVSGLLGSAVVLSQAVQGGGIRLSHADMVRLRRLIEGCLTAPVPGEGSGSPVSGAPVNITINTGGGPVIVGDHATFCGSPKRAARPSGGRSKAS